MKNDIGIWTMQTSTGRFLAYDPARPDIVSSGCTKNDAVKNLFVMTKDVIDYECKNGIDTEVSTSVLIVSKLLTK